MCGAMNVSLTLTTRPRESSAVQTDLMLTLCPVHCEPKLGPANLANLFKGCFWVFSVGWVVKRKTVTRC